MAGIYIHIPFCRHKCHYCNFFSLASGKQKEEFLKALRKEIFLAKDYLTGKTIETIYFGGGTPSVFSPSDLEYLLPSLLGEGPGEGSLPSLFGEGPGEGSLPSLFGEGPGEGELTLELNPEDLTEAYISSLQKTSFNRFSLGVQSFRDEDLVFLNRSHSAMQSIRAVKLLQVAGYDNISIDLIYGIPGSPMDAWMKNLETAMSLELPHISAYALTVEPKTPLAWMIGRDKSPPVDEEQQAAQFRIMMRVMRENSYQHYEISNFCKPGRYAVHNTNYWRGVPYLGLGPSAHSYNGFSRRWNIANLSEYIRVMNLGKPVYEEETLTPGDQYNEYVMTSLRTMWGCSLEKIGSDFGFQISDFFRKNALPYVDIGWLVEKEKNYYLTDEGKLFADRIASGLFITG